MQEEKVFFGEHYSPTMFQERCPVLENRYLGAGHFVLTLGSRKAIQGARPGQFINILCEGGTYLRRPFSFLDIRKGEVDILFRVVGKGTDWLGNLKPGHELDVIGPLGIGFPKFLKADYPLAFVTGGVGYPPLHHLYSHLGTKVKDILFIHGVRGLEEARAYKDILHPGVMMVSEDGSTGHKGRVTDFTSVIQEGTVVACGPMAMLEALHQQLVPKGVKVLISVESPMGCGFGVCFGCSLPRANGQGYLLSCVEGPVLDSSVLFSPPALSAP